MAAVRLPPVTFVDWPRTYRLVPSRYPPIDLFERIGDPSEWETIAAIESLTNDRLRDEVGDISLVPADERLSGPGASPIMAAFTHIGLPTRFSDGSFGVYYASDRLEAAIREVAHHQSVFLRRTSEPKTQIQLRNYVGRIRCDLRDIRGRLRAVHAPNSYTASQRLGAAVRTSGSSGLVYDSVRHTGAENIAIFRPKVLGRRRGKAHVVQGPHVIMDFDGARMTRYVVVGETAWNALA